jgi:predicted ATPase
VTRVLPSPMRVHGVRPKTGLNRILTLVPPRPAPSGGYIRSVEVAVPISERRGYPLDLPAVRNVETLALHPRMTIVVGENGSGKSTLVEGIGVAAGFNAEGSTINFNFRTQRHRPELANHLRLVRSPSRPRTGFFLRAESFFNVATEIERLDEEPGAGPPIGPAYGPRPVARVIAYSPILMSFPDALIYLLTDSGPVSTKWEDLDHVRITREFLNDPGVVLSTLLDDPGD